MRCPNCGWEESQQKEFCPKCRTPFHLDLTPEANEAGSRDTVRSHEMYEHDPWEASPQGTLKNTGPLQKTMDESIERIPTEERIKITEDIKKTVNIFSKLQEKHRISLKPLDPGSSSKTIEFEGTNFAMNRGNIDPNNPHISSNMQALIKRDGEDWIIEDRSQFGTTFLLINRPIILKKGDVIMLGNKRFEIDF